MDKFIGIVNKNGAIESTEGELVRLTLPKSIRIKYKLEEKDRYIIQIGEDKLILEKVRKLVHTQHRPTSAFFNS